MMLSALQGITEFLPVSSSGHLILLSKLTPFPDQGLEMDIAVHVGSILAVMLYFARDIYDMACGLVSDVFKKFPGMQKFFLHVFAGTGSKNFIINRLPQYNAKLFWLLVVGTIPAVAFGLALHSYGMEWLRNTRIIGWNILLFGLLLGWADCHFASNRSLEEMSFKDALLIGLAQCLAMIPGTSRSGITITVSRMLKINRRQAAKFCMLLSIPAISGAGLLVAAELYQSGNWQNLTLMEYGIGYSFIASLAAIFVMMKWLKNYTFLPFVIYRVVLGGGLLLHSYGYF